MRSFVFVIAVVFATIQSSHEEEGKPLMVKIIADYNPPLSFTLDPPSYRAASALSLSCLVENADQTTAFEYEWSSTCTRNCLVRRDAANISFPCLHSYNSGVYTCTVYDLGCVGNASITVNVVGAGIYTVSALSNNSLITTSSRNTIPGFRCLSGSTRANIGHLIDPQENDITFSNSDPFTVSRGLPGALRVRSVRSLRSEETGIYTYRTPDETGNWIEVYFGLYHSGHTGPVISSFTFSLSERRLTLTCSSHNSPPTQVIWEKNGTRIYLNTTSVTSTQILESRTTSAYSNILSITAASVRDLTGEYSCTVSNKLGRSLKFRKSVEALEVSGHEGPVFVGTSRNITCTTPLSVRKIEWLLLNVGGFGEREDGENILVLPLSPNDTLLNGARFTCRVTTTGGQVIQKTITTVIKDFTHTISILPSAPVIAGSKYSLNCTVTSDLPPMMRWLDSSGNDQVNGSDISMAKTVNGNTTSLILTFDSVRISQGGVYFCVSTIKDPYLQKTASQWLTVQIPGGSVAVSRSPSSGTLHMSDPLTLTCLTTLTSSAAMDVPVQVTHQWRGPRGVIVSRYGMQISSVTRSGLQYRSTLAISSLQTTDSGNFTCDSTVNELSSSPYIRASNAQTSSIQLTPAIRVAIEIDYTSPDVYPVYSPPNYRAASGPVTMKCVATGTTGIVTYQWSSTCSSCFAHSTSSQNITNLFLRSRDAGVHTCSVRDGSGNTGSANKTMNIVGAGIYVTHALQSSVSSFSGRQGSLQANGYAVVDVGRSSTGSNTRFYLFCCSNTTTRTGYITLPNYITRSSHHGTAHISRSPSGRGYDGCIYMHYSYSYFSSLSSSSVYKGIHTCRIPDSRGINQFVNIGIYTSYSNPVMYNLQYSAHSNGSVQFLCQVRNTLAPITWHRNGVLLRPSLENSISTVITNRPSSYYQSTLNTCDSPDNVIGNYQCAVNTTTRMLFSQLHVVRGLQVLCSTSALGSTMRCTCSSSDIRYSYIRWYRGNSTRVLHSSSASMSIFISTDTQGDMYTCFMTTGCGTQKRSVTISTTVPDNWATIEITNSSGQDALEDTDYTLMCTVRAVSGMNLPVRMEWVGPDGAVVRSEGNRTVGVVQKQGTISTLTLSFQPVFSADGGRYRCQATIIVPWERRSRQKYTSVHMPVTSQAMFQLKIYSLPHCSKWNVGKANELERFVKREVEQAIKERCNCLFSSSAIYSGEFSCQTFTDYNQATHVTYRAILNGTSDLLPANQLMQHMQDWRASHNTLLYNAFRLRMVKTSECKLAINSFEEEEC